MKQNINKYDHLPYLAESIIIQELNQASKQKKIAHSLTIYLSN